MTSLLDRFRRTLFRHAVAAIADTPPVVRGSQPFTALSMVHRRDVLPYLLAIKTFAHHAQPHRVVVVADPTIDDACRQQLRQQVPFIEILEAASLRRPALPVGGTWERLLAIATLSPETTVVQLDADTVTFERPAEVIEWAGAGHSFLIRSEADVEIVPLDRAAEFGRRLKQSSNHIQAVAEARLDELVPAQAFRYARACSGFTGFGRGHLSVALLEDVSSQMRSMHGPRWDEWGTEQVTSNLLAASAPHARMLPHPRYCNADSLAAQTVVAHYIGYARHVNRDYEHRARSAVRQLRAAA